MKLKRLSAAVIAMAIAAPYTAFAANSIYYDVDTTRVTYSVDMTADRASAKATEDADTTNYVYVKQVYGNGSVIADAFRMTDSAPSGSYTLTVTDEAGTNSTTQAFRHINATQAATAVSGIATASSETQVESLITNNISDLGVEPTFFAANSAAISGFVYRLKTTTMTPQQFWKNYAYAEILVQTSGQTEAVITPILTANAKTLGLDATEYAGYAQDVKNEVAKRFSDGAFADGCDFKALVQEWVALARLNDAESVTAYTELLLTTYASIFTVDRTAYDNSSYKEDIIRDMMAADYTTKELAIAAFATQSGKTRGNVTGGGGAPSGTPSGDGSGSGTGGTTIVIPADPTPLETGLKDVKGHWSELIVNDLYDKGIVSGSDNNFYPDNNITRAEFCTLLAQAFYKGQTGSTSAFYDVTPDNWYYVYVGLLSAKGIVSGMGDGTFGAGNNITRQDMAAIVARCMNDLGKSASAEREMADFTDADSIASYSKDAVEMLYKAGIISGYEDGSFMPTANLTKAEAATVIYKLLNK